MSTERATRNEAAARLDFYLRGALIGYDGPAVRRILDGYTPLLDEALATERRNVVERIKATQPVAVLATDGGPALAYAMRITEWLDSIATGTEED